MSLNASSPSLPWQSHLERRYCGVNGWQQKFSALANAKVERTGTRKVRKSSIQLRYYYVNPDNQPPDTDLC
jgi:hypothetical protein